MEKQNQDQDQEMAIAMALVTAKTALDYIASQARAHEPARKGFRQRLDDMGPGGKASMMAAIPNYGTCLPFLRTAMAARGLVISDLTGAEKARAKYILYTVAVDTLAEYLGHAIPEHEESEYSLSMMIQYIISHKPKLNLDTVPKEAKEAIDTLAGLGLPKKA